MGTGIPVIAQGPTRIRNRFDFPLIHQDLQVPIDGAQGEARHLLQQGVMDLCCRRMGIRRLQPGQNLIPLLGPMATRRRFDGRGGIRHAAILGATRAEPQPKISNFSHFEARETRSAKGNPISRGPFSAAERADRGEADAATRLDDPASDEVPSWRPLRRKGGGEKR